MDNDSYKGYFGGPFQSKHPIDRQKVLFMYGVFRDIAV